MIKIGPSANSGVLRPHLPAGGAAAGRARLRREQPNFSTYLSGANRTGAQPPAAARQPQQPASPASPKAAVEVDAGLFDRPVEPRFAHAVDPADLKDIRLGVRVRAVAGEDGRSGFEVEAVVLDQAGRPVPDAVVLAMVDPSGPAEAGAGEFLPNTDLFGRTRGTVGFGNSAVPRRIKLIAITGNGLQVAREFELPAG